MWRRVDRLRDHRFTKSDPANVAGDQREQRPTSDPEDREARQEDPGQERLQRGATRASPPLPGRLATFDERLTKLQKTGAPGFARVPMEKVYYQIGNIQFWYKDYEQAIDNLKRAVASGGAGGEISACGLRFRLSQSLTFFTATRVERCRRY